MFCVLRSDPTDERAECLLPLFSISLLYTLNSRARLREIKERDETPIKDVPASRPAVDTVAFSSDSADEMREAPRFAL